MKQEFKIGDIVMINGLGKFGTCEVVDCGQNENGDWYYEVYPTEFDPPFAREFPQCKLRVWVRKEV